MRLAVPLLLWLGVVAPAMGQTCDVSGPMGDVFSTHTGAGAPAIGWDVKRSEDAGQESDHFARPQLSLTFGFEADGRLAGPETALVMVSSYSDKAVGDAPPMSAMQIRVRMDGKAGGAWVASDRAGEVLLAKKLRETWPHTLEIDVTGPEGAVEASATYDLSTRASVEAVAADMRKACFR